MAEVVEQASTYDVLMVCGEPNAAYEGRSARQLVSTAYGPGDAAVGGVASGLVQTSGCPSPSASCVT